MATTETAETCFEGWLEKIQRSRKDKQWCILDGHSLTFYRNQRSSCLYSIELSKLKSVKDISTDNEHKFEVLTDRKYVYSAESKDLCTEWVRHIQEAFDAGAVSAFDKDEKVAPPSALRRGSLPQQNTVKEIVKRHSSKHENDNKSEPLKNRHSGTSDAGTGFLSKRQSSGSKVKDLTMRFSGTETSPSIKSPTSPNRSPASPVMLSSPTRQIAQNNLFKENDLKKDSKIISEETEKENENRDSGYNTQPDVIDGHIDDKLVNESENDDEHHNHVENIQNNDKVSSQVKSDNDSETMDITNVLRRNKNQSETEQTAEMEEPAEVVMRRPSVPSVASVLTDSVDYQKDEEEEDSADDIDEGEDLDNLLQLQFDPLKDDVPHPKAEIHSVVTELKDLLLEAGGTDLDGRFVQKDIDIHDATPVQELTSFLKTL